MEAIKNVYQDTSAESLFNQNPIVIEQRVARRIPMLQEEDGNILFDSEISMASIFANYKDPKHLENQNFRALINNRKDYIKNLKFLGKNWTNGESFAPNEKSLNIGTDI